jgi:hypothetical protein
VLETNRAAEALSVARDVAERLRDHDYIGNRYHLTEVLLFQYPH